MRVHDLEIPTEEVAEFCRKRHVREMWVFGSILRNDFRPESDVDVLVAFDADYSWRLRDLIEMEEELTGIFGRKADLAERTSVERSENYIRRRHILNSLRRLYVA
jgi:predicted nucleotidyltransferase